MKKNYNQPEFEIIRYKTADVLTDSPIETQAAEPQPTAEYQLPIR